MRKLLIYFGLLMALAWVAPAQQAPAPDQGPSVNDQVIQQVLEPLRSGMQAQNIDLVLSVFDTKELSSYSDLQANLRALFQQVAQVDLRYQLLQVTSGQGRASA